MTKRESIAIIVIALALFGSCMTTKYYQHEEEMLRMEIEKEQKSENRI